MSQYRAKMLFAAWAILVIAVALAFYAIQRSRVESCQRTYEGIRQVFKPFFRPPDVRTPKEMSDVAKFNRTVDRLKAGCSGQINP